MAAKKKTQQKTNTRKKTARKPAGRVASTSLERTNLELWKEIRENTISRSEFEELREKVRALEAKQS